MDGNKIAPEAIKLLMDIQGETRGFNVKSDRDYVLKRAGQKGLAKLEAKLAEWGCPIEYQDLENIQFVPLGQRVLSLLAIKEAFQWGDEEIRNVCAFNFKFPLVLKLFAPYFVSIQKVMEQAPQMWKKYFTIGTLRFREYHEKEKYCVLELKDFDTHPIMCRCLEGYFNAFAQSFLNTKNVECLETQCRFKGHLYHEFLLKWQ